MRTTLILRDDLVKKAAKLTGIDEKTALVHAGLEALSRVSPRVGSPLWAAPSRDLRRHAAAGRREQSVILTDTSVLDRPFPQRL